MTISRLNSQIPVTCWAAALPISRYTENGQIKRIAYTGDIGRPVDPILASPQPFPQADILITESTYGDRLHMDVRSAEEELAEHCCKYLCQ